MIYSSENNRITTIDSWENNQKNTVNWVVDKKDENGKTLFSDERTTVGWSGNVTNFSFGSGVTLDANYCTMPTITSGISDKIVTNLVYAGYNTIKIDINIDSEIPWFISVAAAATNGLKLLNFKNFNNMSVVHNSNISFHFHDFQDSVNFNNGEFGIGTANIDGTWKIYFKWQNHGTYYFEPFNLNYVNTSYLSQIWNPSNSSSMPSDYSVLPNCVRPLSYNATMENPSVYSNVTNAVFKTPLFADVYCVCDDGTKRQVLFSFNLGYLYSEYPSSSSYFIGRGDESFSYIGNIYNVNTIILLIDSSPGFVKTPYSGKASSQGTLTLSDGNYRGTANISPTESGSSAITQIT